MSCRFGSYAALRMHTTHAHTSLTLVPLPQNSSSRFFRSAMDRAFFFSSSSSSSTSSSPPPPPSAYAPDAPQPWAYCAALNTSFSTDSITLCLV